MTRNLLSTPRRRKFALKQAKPAKDKEHEELLALYEAAGRNIDNFKSDNRTYLVYYSAIAGAIITFHQNTLHQTPAETFPSGIILFFFAIGAFVCCYFIRNNYENGIKSRRKMLGRTVGEFSKVYWRCNFDDFKEWYIPNDDSQNKKVILDKATFETNNKAETKGDKDKRRANIFVYSTQLAYPFIVLLVTCLLLYPNTEKWVETIGTAIISDIISAF